MSTQSIPPSITRLHQISVGISEPRVSVGATKASWEPPFASCVVDSTIQDAVLAFGFLANGRPTFFAVVGSGFRILDNTLAFFVDASPVFHAWDWEMWRSNRVFSRTWQINDPRQWNDQSSVLCSTCKHPIHHLLGSLHGIVSVSPEDPADNSFSHITGFFIQSITSVALFDWEVEGLMALQCLLWQQWRRPRQHPLLDFASTGPQCPEAICLRYRASLLRPLWLT